MRLADRDRDKTVSTPNELEERRETEGEREGNENEGVA